MIRRTYFAEVRETPRKHANSKSAYNFGVLGSIVEGSLDQYSTYSLICSTHLYVADRISLQVRDIHLYVALLGAA